MIKNTVNDPLQEEMLIKQFNESCKNVGYCEYEIGGSASMMYAAETAEAYNAFVESVGIAELQYYNKFGIPLIIKEGTEADGDKKEEPSGNAEDSKDDGDDKKASLKDKAKGALDNAGTAAKEAGNAILEKAKKALTAIQTTLKKMWNTFKERLIEFFNLNKPFLEKYEPTLKKYAGKSAKTKIYNFKPYKTAIYNLRNCRDAVQKTNGNIDEDKKTEFNKEVIKYESVKSLSAACVKEGDLTAGNAINIMRGSSDKIKEANAAFANIDKAIEGYKSQLYHINRNLFSVYTYAASLGRSLIDAYIADIRDESRAARAACIQILKQVGRFGAQKTADRDDARETEEAKKNADNTEKAGGEEKTEEKPKEESARLQNLSVNDMLEMFSFV